MAQSTFKAPDIIGPLIEYLEEERDKINALLREMRAIQRNSTGEKAPPSKPKKKRNSANWTPSPELQQKVLAFVDAHPEGVTVPMTYKEGIATRTSVDRTLRHLRDTEQVRFAGRLPGTNAILYKPLPKVGDNGQANGLGDS